MDTDNWTSTVVEFNPTIIDSSKRIIEGIASSPIYDRTGELITADAIKKAVPDYMVFPSVTVEHSEFTAGGCSKAWYEEGDDRLHIQVKLKNTPEVDRVWQKVLDKELNAFSIAGIRTNTTCNRLSSIDNPCITTGIHINTITLCHVPANPEATIDTVFQKSLETEEVQNMTDENSNPADMVTDDKEKLLAKAIISELRDNGLLLEKSCKENEKEEEEKKPDDEVKKSLEAHANELAELKKSLAEITATLGEFKKSLDAINETPFQKSMAFTIQNGKAVPVTIDTVANTATSNPTFRDEYLKMRFM